MAMSARALETVEIALAAIEEVDKVCSFHVYSHVVGILCWPHHHLWKSRLRHAICASKHVKEQFTQRAAAHLFLSLFGTFLRTANIRLQVQFVAHINKLPDDILRSAELALFCKRPEEALTILAQNKRIYRAIKMNIRLHRWSDALELALKHQTHVDTVLAYRQQHLAQMKHMETNEQFKQWAQQVEVDWDTVKKKIAMEKDQLVAWLVEAPVFFKPPFVSLVCRSAMPVYLSVGLGPWESRFVSVWSSFGGRLDTTFFQTVLISERSQHITQGNPTHPRPNH